MTAGRGGVMNRDEILEIQAGRYLDSRVAEHIFGWTYIRENEEDQNSDGYWHNPNDPLGTFFVNRYSTDIKAAWDIVEKIIATYPYEGRYTGRDPIIITRNDDNTEWYVEVACWGWEYAEHESLPLAICRAALLAKMDSEP